MFKCILLISLMIPSFSWAHLEGEHQLGSIGGVSEPYLSSPIAILTGVGTYDTPGITSSLADGEAQELALKYTRQGLALNHAFQWEDAVRSFYEALRLDPNLSRASLGLSASFTMLNRDSSKLDTVLSELLAKAQKSASGLNNNEQDRLWVDVINLYYQGKFGLKETPLISQKAKAIESMSLEKKLSKLLEELTTTFQDPEAFAFWGWELGQRKALELGISKFPQHMGILHYLVHINENTGEYQIAINYAKTMVQMAPEAPHIVHMYGHVLPMIGRWDEANVYFLKAHCLHQAVLKVTDPLCANVKVQAAVSEYTPRPEEFWHYAHNLQLFGFSLMRTRDLVTAEAIFQKLCDMGDCKSLLEFYLGEKMYDKAFVQMSSMEPNNESMYMGIQAFVMMGEVGQAEQYLTMMPQEKSLERFTAELTLAFAKKNVSSLQDQQLQGFLENATTNPNFDTWSNLLPVLRRFSIAAAQFQAPQAKTIYDAIQKIDPGHPL